MMQSNSPGIPNLVYCNLTKRLFDPSIGINYGSIVPKDLEKEKVWFEVVKNDDKSFNQNPNQYYRQSQCSRMGDIRRVSFSKINFNYGGAIGNSTIQFTAPIQGWFQFHTSGTMATNNGYIDVQTIRKNGQTEKECIRQPYTDGSSEKIFKTAIFSRYLEISEKVEIWEYGYETSQDKPFTFTGHSVL